MDSVFETLAMVHRAGRYGSSARLLQKLDAPSLGRPATVVRQRRHILDGLDDQPGRLQGGDGRFATGAGAFDAHLDLLETELGGAISAGLGGALGQPA